MTPPSSLTPSGPGKSRQAQFITSNRKISLIPCEWFLSIINFVTALEFARQMGIPMPEYISIYAIEVAETDVMSEEMTPAVIPAVQRCVRKIVNEIEKVVKPPAWQQTESFT